MRNLTASEAQALCTTRDLQSARDLQLASKLPQQQDPVQLSAIVEQLVGITQALSMYQSRLRNTMDFVLGSGPKDDKCQEVPLPTVGGVMGEIISRLVHVRSFLEAIEVEVQRLERVVG